MGPYVSWDCQLGLFVFFDIPLVSYEIIILITDPIRFLGLNLILDPKFGFSRVKLAIRIEERVQLDWVGLK